MVFWLDLVLDRLLTRINVTVRSAHNILLVELRLGCLSASLALMLVFRLGFSLSSFHYLLDLLFSVLLYEILDLLVASTHADNQFAVQDLKQQFPGPELVVFAIDLLEVKIQLVVLLELHES